MAGPDTVADTSLATQLQSGKPDGQPADINLFLHATSGLHGRDTGPGAARVKTPDLTLTGIDVPFSATPPVDPVAPLPEVPKPIKVISPPPLEVAPAGPTKTFVPSQSQGHDTDGESKASKIGREALVISGGLGRSFVYGMASLPQRVPEIASSVAIGATLSTISKAGELGTAATFVVGAYFTSKFIVNALNDTARWKGFSEAVNDTWNSDQHKMKDLRQISDTGGNFAFDTSLSYASGYVGYKNKALADLILSVIKLPVPVPVPGIPAPAPMSPLLVGVTPYLAVVPAPFLYRSKQDETLKHHQDQ